jgi:hypothetical protein
MIRFFGCSSPRDEGDDADCRVESSGNQKRGRRRRQQLLFLSLSRTQPSPPTHSLTLHSSSRHFALRLASFSVRACHFQSTQCSSCVCVVGPYILSSPFHSILLPSPRYDTTECGLCSALHSTAFGRAKTRRVPVGPNPTGLTAQCDYVLRASHFSSNTTVADDTAENKSSKH